MYLVNFCHQWWQKLIRQVIQAEIMRPPSILGKESANAKKLVIQSCTACWQANLDCQIPLKCSVHQPFGHCESGLQVAY
jgi:hypothetical protein